MDELCELVCVQVALLNARPALMKKLAYRRLDSDGDISGPEVPLLHENEMRRSNSNHYQKSLPTGGAVSVYF